MNVSTCSRRFRSPSISKHMCPTWPTVFAFLISIGVLSLLIKHNDVKRRRDVLIYTFVKHVSAFSTAEHRASSYT